MTFVIPAGGRGAAVGRKLGVIQWNGLNKKHPKVMVNFGECFYYGADYILINLKTIFNPNEFSDKLLYLLVSKSHYSAFSVSFFPRFALTICHRCEKDCPAWYSPTSPSSVVMT